MLTVGQNAAKRPHVDRRSERGQAQAPACWPSVRTRPSARMLTVGQNAAKRPHVGKRSERGQAPACYPTQLFVDRGAALPAPL